MRILTFEAIRKEQEPSATVDKSIIMGIVAEEIEKLRLDLLEEFQSQLERVKEKVRQQIAAIPVPVLPVVDTSISQKERAEIQKETNQALGDLRKTLLQECRDSIAQSENRCVNEISKVSERVKDEVAKIAVPVLPVLDANISQKERAEIQKETNQSLEDFRKVLLQECRDSIVQSEKRCVGEIEKVSERVKDEVAKKAVPVADPSMPNETKETPGWETEWQAHLKTLRELQQARAASLPDNKTVMPTPPSRAPVPVLPVVALSEMVAIPVETVASEKAPESPWVPPAPSMVAPVVFDEEPPPAPGLFSRLWTYLNQPAISSRR